MCSAIVDPLIFVSRNELLIARLGRPEEDPFAPPLGRGLLERVTGEGGGEWARAFTDHYATVTNYNDATVMRLLVERPTVFATEIPRDR